MGTRRERVVLELEDDFTAGMARAAAASEFFQKSLGRASVQSGEVGSAFRRADQDAAKFSATITRSTRDLDTYSGRLGLLASSIGALGPAAIPITAVAIPAVTGLSQQLGLLALAGGTTVLAFQGVGDALGAMNKAHLEPTAANLEKAQEAMERLSPAAQNLVAKLGSMREELKGLKDAAGSGILPGATDALTELETRLPIVEKILRRVSAATGDALRDGAESLAGPEWDKFFHFIATEAGPEITKLAKSIGNVTHGLAEMWVAFGPLNSDFSSWMLKASRDFNAWATGLSETEGFQEFVAYIRETGPQVADALGAIGNALLQIVQAASPLGGPILQALEAVADVVAAIADSDLGTPIFGMVAALSAANLAMKAFGVATKAVMAQQQAFSASSATNFRTIAGGAARVGLAGAAFSGLADNIGLSATAMGGFVAGPWGAGAGLLYDVATTGNAAGDALERLNSAVRAADFTAINAGLTETSGQVEQQMKTVSGYYKLVFQSLDFGPRSLGSGMFDFDSSDLGRQLAERQALETASGDLRLGVQTVGQFAGIGASGAVTSLEDLERVLQRVKPAMDDLNISTEDLEQGARDGSIVEMGKAIDAWLADPLNRAKISADQFKVSIESVYAALSKRATLRDFESAVDAATASLEENGKTLDIGTAAGRNNQAALDNIAVTALKVAENLEGMNRVRLLSRARREFIATAVDMGMNIDRARRLANELIQLDKVKVKPRVDMDTSAAEAKIARLRAALASLHTSIRVGVETPYGAVGRANGGMVRGPGTSTSDSIPAMLSDGEFVVRAAAVNKYGPEFFARANAMRLADGGLATYARTGGGSGEDRLVKSLDGLKESIDKASTRRDRLMQQRDSLRSTVSESFQSDLFGAPSDVWSASANSSDWRTKLKSDIARARAFTTQVRTLSKKGLDGQALAAIASTGSLDVAREFAGMSRAELGEYERLYNVRERVTSRAGTVAGSAAFGDQLSESNSHLRELNRRVASLEKAVRHDGPKATGDAVGRSINHAASRGTRNRKQ